MSQELILDATNLTQHMRMLTERIGVRLAGSAAEHAAAKYVAAEFEKIGARTTIEAFPMMTRDVTEQLLEVRVEGAWRKFPCSLFAGAPGTTGKLIEAPLIFFESPAEQQRADLSSLHGKAVVHLGCHFETRDIYRRIIQAEPAFLLCVDIRYPGDRPLADGLFPTYVKSMGAVPTMNVAYLDAWNWQAGHADAARLLVKGGMKPGLSSNVIATLPGESDDCEVVIAGAHHDTQADSVGADDNASGVVGLLELARVLAKCPRRRAIRLISFGTEEQLSVGSANYVCTHKAELGRNMRLMFNLDSYGSRMGWNELLYDGSKQWGDYLRRHFEIRNMFARLTASISPYVDAFPFQALGIPAVTLMRENCTTGRFFHHRHDDDMTRIDPDVMARLLSCVASLLVNAASSPALPFERRISAELTAEAQRWWKELFES